MPPAERRIDRVLSPVRRPMHVISKGFKRAYRNKQRELFGLKIKRPFSNVFLLQVSKIMNGKSTKPELYASCKATFFPDAVNLHAASLEEHLLEKGRPKKGERGRRFLKIFLTEASRIAVRHNKKHVLIDTRPGNRGINKLCKDLGGELVESAEREEIHKDLISGPFRRYRFTAKTVLA